MRDPRFGNYEDRDPEHGTTEDDDWGDDADENGWIEHDGDTDA